MVWLCGPANVDLVAPGISQGRFDGRVLGVSQCCPWDHAVAMLGFVGSANGNFMTCGAIQLCGVGWPLRDVPLWGGTRFRRVEVLSRGFLCERVCVLTFLEWPAVWSRLLTCINPVFGTMPNRVPLNEKLRPKTDRNFGSDFWEAIVTDSVEIVAPTLGYRTTSTHPLASLLVCHEPMSRISYVFETRI